MSRRPPIIGLTGALGSGKSTAARLLTERHGYVRTRFADPLKAMLKALGLSDAQVDGVDKEHPTPLLGGRTPRLAMQTLGTEWGRQLIHPDLWVLAWAARIDAEAGPFVVDDLRFPNEAAAVKARGGVIIRIDRPGFALGEHVSESGQARLEVDASIVNSGRLHELHLALESLLKARDWLE